MTKVNEANWSQLDFLINNFYEIVEYKRGRGIYRDRVIWKRPKNVKAIFGEPERLFEFYYMDANAVKELNFTIREKVKSVARIVTSVEDFNVLTEFEGEDGVEPAELSLELKRDLIDSGSVDFAYLNKTLLENYKLTNKSFREKLQEHRRKQYFLASSDEYNFITKEYAEEQLNVLENAHNRQF